MSCNCNKPCGCVDTTLTSPVTALCNNAEPCEEVVYAGCVAYTGNNIVDAGISTGDRMDIIVKKLVMLYTNPECIDPTATCQAITDFQVLSITTTGAIVYWSVPGAPATISAVTLEYSTDPTFATSTTVDVTASTQWTIINLLPNTNYYVRMITGTTLVPECCTSVTLNFKTLAS
jgi:hypothetical protein